MRRRLLLGCGCVGAERIGSFLIRSLHRAGSSKWSWASVSRCEGCPCEIPDHSIPATLRASIAVTRPLTLGRAPTGRTRPYPGLDPHAPEQTRLGLGDDDDLGIAHCHTKLVKRKFGCLGHGLSRYFYPLHALSSLSCPLGSRARALFRHHHGLDFRVI